MQGTVDMPNATRKKKTATHPSILKVGRVRYVAGAGLPTELIEIDVRIGERLARLGDNIYFVLLCHGRSHEVYGRLDLS